MEDEGWRPEKGVYLFALEAIKCNATYHLLRKDSCKKSNWSQMIGFWIVAEVKKKIRSKNLIPPVALFKVP